MIIYVSESSLQRPQISDIRFCSFPFCVFAAVFPVFVQRLAPSPSSFLPPVCHSQITLSESASSPSRGVFSFLRRYLRLSHFFYHPGCSQSLSSAALSISPPGIERAIVPFMQFIQLSYCCIKTRIFAPELHEPTTPGVCIIHG